jgi:hypothetical protein
MKRLLLAATLGATLGAAACAGPARPVLQLEGARLTVYNDSDEAWHDVEVLLNHHFRMTPDDMPPEQVVHAPLDVFVAGYGQRFNFKTMQITDLRLRAKRPNGEPFEVKYEFSQGGLEEALGGFKGKS